MRRNKIDNLNINALVDFGFTLKNNKYLYNEEILNGKFRIEIEVKPDEKSVSSIVIDNITNLEYVLVDVNSASGNYVGKVKEAYESIYQRFEDKCVIKEKYHSKQLKRILEYIHNNYHDELEYLWLDSPTSSIIRNQKNRKWYLVVMVIDGEKIGLSNENKIEIIDVRFYKGNVQELIDMKAIFPAFHMNKNSWVTIKLDVLDDEIIYSLIDTSYKLSTNK